MSNLLALDQSSRITGYAIFIDGKLEHFGKFIVDDDNIDIRLVKIRNKVQELVTQYDITEVVLEDIQQQNNIANNVQTFKILAEVYGVIVELLTELKIPHISVLSTSWKSTLNIKGRDRQTQKRNAQSYVTQTYNIKATQDESDAICIGDHYLKQNPCAW